MKALAAALALLAAGQAQALSCMRPDPVATFNRVAEVPEPYIVLKGQMAFDASKMPQGVSAVPRTPEAVPARFVGQGLTLDGFTNSYAADVVIQPTCAGSWCGGAVPGVDVLVFARVDGARPVIEAAPCGGFIFPEPDAAMLDAMTACIRGEECTPADPFQ